MAGRLAPPARLLDFGAGPADRTAVLAELGYRCTAMDDLGDEWHSRGRAREKILAFADEVGVDYVVLDSHTVPATGEFDMVMLHDVLEHLHDSPRDLLSELVSRLAPDGLLYVTVPNHVNLRKRLAVLRGKTSHPMFEMYYWYPGSWRGHVREYTHGDLVALAGALGLDVVEIRGVHHMLQNVPPRMRPAYRAISSLFPGVRDSWSMLARKPRGWQARTELSDDELRSVTGLTSWGEVGH
ncbi:class I SAM-dependent methyltransferase [Williamsia maris]|uniref:class I SAM-dependent methyltransferase n=1 Tax=Williamsia maris TaxID=72806 RepID=UPI0020A2AD9C|nr:methyltransferase domain-containing protein [Williamsia maris]